MKKPSTIKSKKLNPTRFGLDVWISLGVHGVLLVILGLWVVVTIQNTPVLSVVAATVESNEVLMETPAESISQLDSTSTDSTSITTPDTSELKIGRSVCDFSRENRPRDHGSLGGQFDFTADFQVGCTGQ